MYNTSDEPEQIKNLMKQLSLAGSVNIRVHSTTRGRSPVRNHRNGAHHRWRASHVMIQILSVKIKTKLICMDAHGLNQMLQLTTKEQQLAMKMSYSTTQIKLDLFHVRSGIGNLSDKFKFIFKKYVLAKHLCLNKCIKPNREILIMDCESVSIISTNVKKILIVSAGN